VRLSPNFTLAELCVSAAASRANISNIPTGENTIAKLKDLAWRMEIVRVLLGGRPIVINSGYRTPQVNRLVGGSPTSDHMQAVACDFTRVGLTVKECADIIQDSALDYDQLILYKTHLHIGFGARMRKERFNAK
jgi:zinc D-Ala-D-Ala carboxypeptidase